MKVTVVSLHPLNDNRIYHFIRSLIRCNVKINYINVSKTKYSLDVQFPITQLDYNLNTHNPFSFFKTWRFVRREVKKSEGDIIHVHDLYLLPAVLGIKGKKVVFDRHERFEIIPSFLAKFFSWYERINISRITGCVYTVENEEEYLKNIGYKHLACIPNYQSVEDFDKFSVYAVPSETINVVYIGSLSNVDRNIDLILEVYDRLLSEHSNVKCILGGKTSDAFVSDSIRVLTEKYKNFDYIGVCSHDDVIKYTMGSDVGLLFFRETPNTKCSSSNKLYEYLLGGTFFVGVGEFCLQDEILSKEAGIVFPYETNAATICCELNKIISNKADLQKKKKAAKEIGEMYIWENVCDRYMTMYNEIKQD